MKEEKIVKKDKVSEINELAKKISNFKKPLKYSKELKISYRIDIDKTESLLNLIVEIKCSKEITKEDETKALLNVDHFIPMLIQRGFPLKSDINGIIHTITLAKMDEGNPNIKDVIKFLIKLDKE